MYQYKRKISLSLWDSLSLSRVTEAHLKVPRVCLSEVEEAMYRKGGHHAERGGQRGWIRGT